MSGTEKVVKHLEMIQSIVDRLGRNSFLLKSWSMTVLVAALVLIGRQGLPSSRFLMLFVLPVVGFWAMDAYFLRQERLFRHLYEEVRKQEDTDYDMNVDKYNRKPGCNFLSSLLSPTLLMIYVVEVVLVCAVSVFFVEAGS